MSVPLRYRSENKLQAYKDTLAFCHYTIKIIENEKYFPKKSRWNMCSRIMDLCIDCVEKISKANKINPRDADDAKKRTDLQYEVILNFEALFAIMNICRESYSIDGNIVENWSTFLMTAENTVTAWRKSDIKRFKNLSGD